MIKQSVRMLGSSLFAGSVVLATTSCATQETVQVPSKLEASAYKSRQKLAQLNFGREAAFALCAEPACPTVTRKTLPGDSAQVVNASRRFIQDGSASSDAASPQPIPAAAAPAAATPAPAPPVPKSEEVAIPRVTAEVMEPQRAFVTFGFGSAYLTDPSKEVLRRSLSNARSAERIVISGRTDSVGDQKANEALALSRAMAVREYLRDQLPDLPNIISIDARGRCCFVATNDTSDGRAKNRRVEVAFLPKGGA